MLPLVGPDVLDVSLRPGPSAGCALPPPGNFRKPPRSSLEGAVVLAPGPEFERPFEPLLPLGTAILSREACPRPPDAPEAPEDPDEPEAPERPVSLPLP